MVKLTEGNLTANGINIHYYRTGGAKPPFVLLHGSTDSGLCWLPLADWLSAGYDLIMPDAQGHGLSDRFTPAFASTDFSSQTARLIQHLNLKNPLLMGHSMGADTIVDMTLLHTVHPSAIILEDPIWQTQPLSEQADRRLLKRRQKMEQAVTSFQEKSSRELFEDTRQANPTWSEDELRYWVESKKQFDTSLFDRVRDKRYTFDAFMTQADCPTLLITSDWGMVSPETAREAQQLWKSKSLFQWVRIADAGHNIRRDQFAKFKEAVEAFLEKVK